LDTKNAILAVTLERVRGDGAGCGGTQHFHHPRLDDIPPGLGGDRLEQAVATCGAAFLSPQVMAQEERQRAERLAGGAVQSNPAERRTGPLGAIRRWMAAWNTFCTAWVTGLILPLPIRRTFRCIIK